MERFRAFSEEVEKIFFRAIRTGDLGIVLMFLEAGIDPNISDSYGSTPLYVAVAHNKHVIVSLLLALGVNPNAREHGWGIGLLHFINSDNPEILKPSYWYKF